MLQSIKAWFAMVKTWLIGKMPIIKYEVKSIAQTFLAGMSSYLFVNWELVKSLAWSKSALVGLAIALVRAGWKMVWILIEPQIVALFKYLSGNNNT